MNPGAVPDAGTTGFSSGYPQYNILLIIVDQMRNPAFWLPSGNNWIETYGSAGSNTMPNIARLASQYSFVFPNYFVAATACTPSRACLLTGLYSQQTCMFQTVSANSSIVPPPLLPYNSSWVSGNGAGFPTIGNVLSQSFGGQNGYNCTWIGKWHLSCYSGVADGLPGQNGPSDYGFESPYNIPTANTSNPYPGGTDLAHVGYPSPNGLPNGGAGGDFLDAFTQSSNASFDPPAYGWNNANAPYRAHSSNNWVQPAGNTQLSDAGIADAFTSYFLPYAANNLNAGTGANGQLLTPWFCAVSFINPHDISDFPYAYGLASSGNNEFGLPSLTSDLIAYGYQPAPVIGGNNSNNYSRSDPGVESPAEQMSIPQFRNAYTSLPPGAGNAAPWNFEVQIPDGSAKPVLQPYHQVVVDEFAALIQSPGSYNNGNNGWPTPTAWQTFLNYYVWLQSCVDYQVGQVLGTNVGGASGLAQSAFNNNTLVIFTADHGEYAGSHGLRGKGGGLYEESMNVPLIISFPSARNANNSSNNGYPHVLPYVCSSVDLLPFLYSISLGNEGWRNNNSDLAYYLSNRESLFDGIYYWNNTYSQNPWPGVPHRRISGISLYNNSTGSAGWQLYQPFVLHTTDEYPVVQLAGSNNITGSNYHPGHAVAFRTVDQTESTTTAAPFYGQQAYGGGKLGVYSFWDTADPTNAPIEGIPSGFGGSPPAEYEFYNYSPSQGNANPQEIGNQFYAGNGYATPEANNYYADFFNLGSNNGINVQDELYNLYTAGGNNSSSGIAQVTQAIQTAFSNYIVYLKCTNKMTGSDGLPASSSCPAGSNNYYTW